MCNFAPSDPSLQQTVSHLLVNQVDLLYLLSELLVLVLFQQTTNHFLCFLVPVELQKDHLSSVLIDLHLELLLNEVDFFAEVHDTSL